MKTVWLIRWLLGLILGLALVGCTLPGGRAPVAGLPTPPTPEATSTPLPSPTRTLHPMNIQSMRQTPYPGSDIQIEETLDAGGNFYRYIASYQSEGLKIYGLLTVPFGEMPVSGWPAIVFNHGYIPPEIYKSTERYIAHVNNLASHGYIVFRIDYRGHDRSEGEAGGAYSRTGYTVDVLNAVASLQRFPQVDPQRIGMWGHSMGGFLTLRAMVISPEIKAGVIWGGVVASYPDLFCCWRTPTPAPTLAITPTPELTPRGFAALAGEELSQEERLVFWLGLSANHYLGDLSGPLQLHHGSADSEVPIQFSRDLYQQLQSAGQTTEFYEYAGDNHNISNSYGLAMTRTLNFFDKYLKENP